MKSFKVALVARGYGNAFFGSHSLVDGAFRFATERLIWANGRISVWSWVVAP
jgi:hypothetical protein